MKKPIQVIQQQSEIFTFGKYKYKTIQYILRTDPGYILWLDEQRIVSFPGNIISLATDKMDDMYNPYEEYNHNYSSYYDED